MKNANAGGSNNLARFSGPTVHDIDLKTGAEVITGPNTVILP